MKSQKKIVIVDYGVGNLWSLGNAVRLFASDVSVTEEKEKIESADALILPGVGAFAAGMDGLNRRGLTEVIKSAAKAGKPILGICLGAQLLLEKGYEFGEHEGLGLIAGSVEHFPTLGEKVKVPAIGWQHVQRGNTENATQLFNNIEDPTFYFVHSYILKPALSRSELATTSYAGFHYCAVVGEGNIVGTQFHPERSGKAGLTLLQNFISSV